MCICVTEFKIPGYRSLHHIRCSQDEVFTYIQDPVPLYLQCPPSISFLGFQSQMSPPPRNLPWTSWSWVKNLPQRQTLNIALYQPDCHCRLVWLTELGAPKCRSCFMASLVPSMVLSPGGISKPSISYTPRKSHKSRLRECVLAFKSDKPKIFIVHCVPSTDVGIGKLQEIPQAPSLCSGGRYLDESSKFKHVLWTMLT